LKNQKADFQLVVVAEKPLVHNNNLQFWQNFVFWQQPVAVIAGWLWNILQAEPPNCINQLVAGSRFELLISGL
jgi:hypothetical protein